jgi:membrane peptidoglycan carboxypeptidase
VGESGRTRRPGLVRACLRAGDLGARTLVAVPRPARRPPAVSQLGKAALTSAVAGLLVAGLVLPLVGGVGLAAKSQADEFLVLPAELETPPLAQRSRILAADGSLIASLYSENRVVVALGDVPELARKAVLAIEDSRFYAHNGVDVKGTLRAAVANAQADAVTQGGSTLTQQYVKNALIQAATTREQQVAAREATFDRKLREARYALAIERQLTKDQILERYLNIAYFGNGVYGLGTAASFYFGKPVQELTLAESALLAGIVQSPGRWDPVRNLEATVSRRNVVLTRMAEVGYVTEEERAAAVDEVPELRLSPVGSGCEAPEVTAPFFCDYVRRVLEDGELGAVLGRTREERQQRLLAGGLTITTTLDPRVQAAAQAAADGGIPRDDPSEIATAINMVEPGTGAVKAMAVNRTFAEEGVGQTKVNLAIGGSSGFQGGSTFKPFVLARALQMNIPLTTSIRSPQTYSSKVFTDYKDGKKVPYRVSNAGDSQAGTYNLESGTHGSVNTFYVQLQERTGVERPAALAESIGVKQFQDGRPQAPLLRSGSFTLGTNEISPLAMAGAYATFAARGMYCPPNPVLEVRDASGEQIGLPAPPCQQAVEREVADTVNSVLRGVIDGPSRGRTGRGASIGRPAAGKTGSTNGSKAAWFVGYTPQLATSVWVGKPRPVEMKRIRIAGRYYPQVYGGTLPAGIWQKAMAEAMQGVPVEDFPRPSSRDSTVPVPDVRGMPEDVATKTLTEAGFEVRPGGSVPVDGVPAGHAAYTSPTAGSPVEAGSSLILYLSNGRSPEPDQPPAEEPDDAAADPGEPPGQAAGTAPAVGRGNNGNQGGGGGGG